MIPPCMDDNLPTLGILTRRFGSAATPFSHLSEYSDVSPRYQQNPTFLSTHKDTHTPAYPCCFTSSSLSKTCCVSSRRRPVIEGHKTSQHYHHLIITILGVTLPGDMAAKGNIGGILGRQGENFSGVAGYDFYDPLSLYAFNFVCCLRMFAFASCRPRGFFDLFWRLILHPLLLRLHIFLLLQRHLFGFVCLNFSFSYYW